jgi:hypothetical protein
VHWWGAPASRVVQHRDAGCDFLRVRNMLTPHIACPVQPEDVPGMKEAGWSAGNAFKAG